MNHLKTIENIFNKVASSKGIHEAVLLVENTKGDFSFDLGYVGRTVDSPIFTASIGKLFTTTCILILERQNKLVLSDPLTKYFDLSILDSLHIFKGVDYSNQFTISNLLFQTSGIPDWLENGRDKMLSASGSGDGMTTARELMTFLKAFFDGTFFPKDTFRKLSKYGQLQITMGGVRSG